MRRFLTWSAVAVALTASGVSGALAGQDAKKGAACEASVTFEKDQDITATGSFDRAKKVVTLELQFPKDSSPYPLVMTFGVAMQLLSARVGSKVVDEHTLTMIMGDHFVVDMEAAAQRVKDFCNATRPTITGISFLGLGLQLGRV